jgi:hypothetical protein
MTDEVPSMFWLHLLFYILLAATLVGGLYIILMNFPGTWLMVLGATIYAVATKFEFIGFKTIIAAVVIAGIAEVVDFFAGAAGAKKAGASRRGLWCAVIGGIIAGLFLTIPFPVIGTIIGVCIGTFVGAIVGEAWAGSSVNDSLRIGLGAAWGRLLGILAKLLFGCIIFLVVMIPAVPYRYHKKAAIVPAVPARAPTTARVN